ncbi:MAG: hypothetical protein RLZZ490_1547 [Cyanobacteriota bacterium]
MTPQALIILILWFPFTIFLCATLPIRRAIAISFLGAFLFLPSRAGVALPLIPSYDKLTSTYYALMVGIAIFDRQSILKYRFHIIDLSIIVYFSVDIITSLSNGLGLYDGISQCLRTFFRWGIPYFLGRIYFNDFKHLKNLAILTIQAGIIYVPLCLWEIKMSPHLHRVLYGYFSHPSGVNQQIRSFGLWRPIVFTGHGLVASLFMLFAFFLAFWVWQSKTVDKIWGVNISLWTFLIGFTFVMMQSRGTYVYFIIMAGIFISAKYLKSNFAYLLVLSLMIYYMYSVASGLFDGIQIVSWIAKNVSPERAQSLAFRWDNEQDMAAKARLQPLFGWGNWGRNRVYAYDWKGEIVDTSVTDSIFMLTYGVNGLVGVVSFYTTILLPSSLFCLRKYPVKTWFHPKIGPAVALALFSLIFCLDTLLNAPLQPLLMLSCGAIAGLVVKPTESLTMPKGIGTGSTQGVGSALPLGKTAPTFIHRR